MKTFRQFMEDGAVPGNTAGGGHIGGLGGASGEPGVAGKLLRRKDPNLLDDAWYFEPIPAPSGSAYVSEDTFAGSEVFDVDPDVFHACKFGKIKFHRWMKYVGDTPIGQQIRAFGLKNPKKTIIVRDRTTGSMMYLRHPHLDQFRAPRPIPFS